MKSSDHEDEVDDFGGSDSEAQSVSSKGSDDDEA